MINHVTKTIDLSTGNPDLKKQEIKTYFESTYAVDEKLYQLLNCDEAFYQRADPLRHPLIFYIGHTATFFINKLILAKLIDQRINPVFESIFAIGVDEMSWDDLNEQNYNWPSVSEIFDYRAKVKDVVLKLIEQTPLTLPIGWENPFWIILMGIEHERIHLETSSVLIRQLPLHLIKPLGFENICESKGQPPKNELIEVEGASVKMGKAYGHRFYGWDNEYGNFSEEVAAFKASKYLISNAEFLEFIVAEGYEKQEYWDNEGWAWRTYQKAKHPRFWRADNNRYLLRLVAHEIEMPWNWPVEINYLEAKAFANWQTSIKGATYRLPTEAEWYRIAEVSGINENNFHQTQANINLEKWSSPGPVDHHQHGQFFDVIGNVWQWTETPITGFPGFKVHPMYDDFSTPTFDGQHNMIKGGSWISTGNEDTWHARYAFRRHFYQHAGFRLVQSDNPLNIRNDVYETDEQVAQSCEINYGKSALNFKNFPVQLAEKCIELMKGRQNVNALDLNCDTGRAAFEMATHFDQVTGLDLSARFIRVATQMQEKGFIRYISKNENELVNYNDIQLSVLELQNKGNIKFLQADANNLKPIYCAYDLILAVNLIEELYAPDDFLKTIHERLNANGILVLGSTYNWEKNQIKKEHWPGGFKKDGEPFTALDSLKTLLSDKFVFIEPPFDIVLAKPKTAREHEVDISEITAWKLR